MHVVVIDHDKKRTFVIRKNGLPDAGIKEGTMYKAVYVFYLPCISELYNEVLTIGFAICFDLLVLWNPWRKKSRKISDLGDDDYKQMLCIGAAVGENPIILQPGDEWQGSQEIIEVPSSYCSGLLEASSSFDE
jgi:glucose-6-phosphate 1-epimerase